VNGHTVLELDGDDVEELDEGHGVVEGTKDIDSKKLAFLAMLLPHGVVGTWHRWPHGNNNVRMEDHVLEVGINVCSACAKGFVTELTVCGIVARRS
jgi:hypothetical protein